VSPSKKEIYSNTQKYMTKVISNLDVSPVCGGWSRRSCKEQGDGGRQLLARPERDQSGANTATSSLLPDKTRFRLFGIPNGQKGDESQASRVQIKGTAENAETDEGARRRSRHSTLRVQFLGEPLGFSNFSSSHPSTTRRSSSAAEIFSRPASFAMALCCLAVR
jgi:hypothetical protein